MMAAVALARRGHGNVSANPSVGCVLVRNGRTVGRGWTQPGGRPHAETVALGRAGSLARGATAYVTLEPCAHHGQTPPCAEALAAAGVARVVVGVRDPDPRVDGAGVRFLEKAGIEVVTGVRGDAAAEAAAGFLTRIREGRPLVTVKLATSLDGRIATSEGRSRWITGESARRHAHGLRARSDAILVGNGTAIADDPDLGCRLPGLEDRSPVRVVLGGRRRLPPSHRLVTDAPRRPTWLVVGRRSAEPAGPGPGKDGGVEVIEVDGGERPDPAAALAALGARGINRLMVEGGGRTVAALLAEDLVDRLVWYRAPLVLGGDGVPAVSGFGTRRLDEAANFARLSTRHLGRDAVEFHRRIRKGE